MHKYSILNRLLVALDLQGRSLFVQRLSAIPTLTALIEQMTKSKQQQSQLRGVAISFSHYLGLMGAGL